MTLQKAMFGEGCFWGVQARFDSLKGVISNEVGYSGGHIDQPTYKDVCRGNTGHAEVVQITFDPEILSFEALLDEFWKSHDPTTKNRQGPDVGNQYRSAIFYYDQIQKEQSMKSMEQAQSKFSRPIVTEISAAKEFFKAEEYHQKYFEKNGRVGCGVHFK
jgi:peptide-methionine (S)-S-oxide reductase